MKITIIDGDYLEHRFVMAEVEHDKLDSTWTTSIFNVQKTLEMLYNKKTQVEEEIALNEEILSGIQSKVQNVNLLIPQEETIA